MIDFFRNYADRKHHGKEENILFMLLGKKGLHESDLALMRKLAKDHVTARQTTAEMLGTVKRYQGGDQAEPAVIKSRSSF